MPAPLNIECFRNDEAIHNPAYRFKPEKVADALALARGWKIRDGDGRIPSRLQTGNAGIFNPTRYPLHLGNSYYRFCDSRRTRSISEWWIEHETFVQIRIAARTRQTILDYAKKTGVSPLAYSAKLHLAIPYEWGDCEHIVEARLLRDMDAYRGRGNIAFLHNDPDKRDRRDGDAKYIPIDPNLPQLFIPDVRVHFQTVFHVVKSGSPNWFM